MEQVFGYVLSAIVGAFGSAIPVWITLRKANADIKKQNGELLLELRRGELQINQEGRINTEAEWKRVIDDKEKELVRLRAKDDEQEVKIDNLLTRHIECKQNEARQDERCRHLTERCDRQDGDIKALTNKILQLERLLRNDHHAHEQSGGSPGDSGHPERHHAEEEARQ